MASPVASSVRMPYTVCACRSEVLRRVRTMRIKQYFFIYNYSKGLFLVVSCGFDVDGGLVYDFEYKFFQELAIGHGAGVADAFRP